MQKNFFDLVKLIEHLASAVSPNSCIGSSPRTKISFFLLPVCVDERFSTSKTIILLPQSIFENKKCDCESNPISYQNKNIYQNHHT